MPSEPLPPLPARPEGGHKGTFGTVCVLGGCARHDVRMLGAPALVARAALRAGCGLARVLAPEPIMDGVIALCPSATGLPVATDHERRMIPHEAARVLDESLAGAACLVVGPGLGSGEEVQAPSLRAVQQENVPVVVDADALNALAEIPELPRDFRAAAILTPHPGEYRRLASSLNIALDPVAPESRPAAAEALAQRLGCIVVLKGHGTIVTDGHRTWTNDTGGSELSTAGTGDVLSGLIAGIVAQHVANKSLSLLDAARLGVRAHGLAGEMWRHTYGAQAGLLAMDLTSMIPAALESLRAAR
jgi:NAD(P)H-hydrate epimerase